MRPLSGLWLLRRRDAEACGFNEEWSFGRIHQLQEQLIITGENAEVVHVACFGRETCRGGHLGDPLEAGLQRDADAMIAWWDGKKRIGSVIVLKNGKPYGIFTERDLLTNVLSNDVETHNPVGGYCTTTLVTSSIGIKAGDASKVLSKNKIKRLVLTKAKKIHAIVTARDIVEAFTMSFSNED